MANWSLAEKLIVLEYVVHSCRLPIDMWRRAIRKVSRGHADNYGQQADWAEELSWEITDIPGYITQLILSRRGCLRLWLIGVLAGLQWRLLRPLLPAEEPSRLVNAPPPTCHTSSSAGLIP